MRYLYFDLIGGISGDMIAASLLDLTGDVTYLKNELKKINLKGYRVKSFKRQSGHIQPLRFTVEDLVKGKRIFQFNEIKNIVNKSRLKNRVKKSILKVYSALYEAEKEVHGFGHAHFQQIGEVDSIIDIASACILIDSLNVDGILYSSVPFGNKVAPATTLLLKSKDIYFSKHPYENITPTGAAVISALGSQINSKGNSGFAIKDAGYGAGSIEYEGFSNILRSILLEKGKSDFE
jgi:uncharacterized protein (DUF111 family)